MQRQILSTNTRIISVMSTAVYILANVTQSNLIFRHNSHDFSNFSLFFSKIETKHQTDFLQKRFINSIVISSDFDSLWQLSMELR